MQVCRHLTWVAWVGHASLAGAPRNLSSQLLSCIYLLQLRHLLSTKLAYSDPSYPFLPTPPSLKRYGCGVSIPSTERISVMVPSGSHLQSCYGYLLSALNVTQLFLPQGTNAQAYLLLMNLTYLRASFRIQPFQDFY